MGLRYDQDEDPEVLKEAELLCPELSPPTQNKLDAERQAAQKNLLNANPALQKLLDLAASMPSTSSVHGIKLLALDLIKNRELFLWWD